MINCKSIKPLIKSIKYFKIIFRHIPRNFQNLRLIAWHYHSISHFMLKVYSEVFWAHFNSVMFSKWHCVRIFFLFLSPKCINNILFTYHKIYFSIIQQFRISNLMLVFFTWINIMRCLYIYFIHIKCKYVMRQKQFKKSSFLHIFQ